MNKTALTGKEKYYVVSNISTGKLEWRKLKRYQRRDGLGSYWFNTQYDADKWIRQENKNRQTFTQYKP